jgi:hypothetical protein
MQGVGVACMGIFEAVGTVDHHNVVFIVIRVAHLRSDERSDARRHRARPDLQGLCSVAMAH